MKKILFTLILLSQLTFSAFSQSGSPYKTRFAVDGPLAIGGVALNGLGLMLVQKNKSGLSEAERIAIDMDIEKAKQNVPAFDRFSAGYFNENAKLASDYLFYGSLPLPFLLLADKNVKSNAGQIGVLYLETMALSGAIFTFTVANVTRNRPLTYNNSPENDERLKKHSQNSFFAGHTSTTATATFFAAKIFHDFNPDSELRPYIWGAAAAIPATVGFLRLRAGKHFLSDNIIGYVIGAGSGILVPQLHKKKDGSGISIIPVTGEYTGMAASVTF